MSEKMFSLTRRELFEKVFNFDGHLNGVDFERQFESNTISIYSFIHYFEDIMAENDSDCINHFRIVTSEDGTEAELQFASNLYSGFHAVLVFKQNTTRKGWMLVSMKNLNYSGLRWILDVGFLIYRYEVNLVI